MGNCFVCSSLITAEMKLCKNCGYELTEHRHHNPNNIEEQIPKEVLDQFQWYANQLSHLKSVDSSYKHQKIFFQNLHNRYTKQKEVVDKLYEDRINLTKKIEKYQTISLKSIISTIQQDREKALNHLLLQAEELDTIIAKEEKKLDEIVEKTQIVDKELQKLHKLVRFRMKIVKKFENIVLKIDIDHPNENILQERLDLLKQDRREVSQRLDQVQQYRNILRSSLQHYQRGLQLIIDNEYLLKFDTDLIIRMLTKEVIQGRETFYKSVEIQEQTELLQNINQQTLEREINIEIDNIMLENKKKQIMIFENRIEPIIPQLKQILHTVEDIHDEIHDQLMKLDVEIADNQYEIIQIRSQIISGSNYQLADDRI